MKLSGETRLLLIMGGFVLLGGGTLAGLNMAGGAGAKLPFAPPPAATPAPTVWTSDKYATLLKDARNVRGDVNAPLTVVEFADFECPSCRRAYENTISKWEKSSKPVRFVFHHLPLTGMHPRAMPAALAAEAAGKQGKFWPMYDVLFNGLETELTDDYILSCAKKVGLDLTKFGKDWKNEAELTPFVTADQTLAKQFNITSTPTFVVRDKTGKITEVAGADQMAALMEGKPLQPVPGAAGGPPPVAPPAP